MDPPKAEAVFADELSGEDIITLSIAFTLYDYCVLRISDYPVYIE